MFRLHEYALDPLVRANPYIDLEPLCVDPSTLVAVSDEYVAQDAYLTTAQHTLPDRHRDYADYRANAHTSHSYSNTSKKPTYTKYAKGAFADAEYFATQYPPHTAPFISREYPHSDYPHSEYPHGANAFNAYPSQNTQPFNDYPSQNTAFSDYPLQTTNGFNEYPEQSEYPFQDYYAPLAYHHNENAHPGPCLSCVAAHSRCEKTNGVCARCARMGKVCKS